MIVATKEIIYGLQVYTFKNSHKVPYQLTFDPGVSNKNIQVSLVNLWGEHQTKYCRYIRKAVSQYIIEYILETKKPVYFTVEVHDDGRGFPLLKKFIRWADLEPRVEIFLDLTKVDNVSCIEFHVKKNTTYLKSLTVK
ncbi:MAG: hypothetical protein WBG71_00080 [Leeuwenhoekiella sp.]